MKTAVIGSRSFKDYALLRATLEPYALSLIISGGALGADRLAKRYGKEKGIATTVFTPDYAQYGKKAPLIRNQQIVDAAELVIL